jgi:hypothetical protein
MHYAILHNKGLIFLDSTNYDQKFRKMIQQKASILAVQVVNLSEFNGSLNLDFNTNQYPKFFNNYIKESSSNKSPSWVILFNEFVRG